ncbi:MAG TPA: tetratricopeptide repeat protein [Acidiferrobacterales bacterium]|nr:tetratricopeptide repeat protein [Acidiferrobacterales bacterium]
MTQQSTIADLLAAAVRQHEAGELVAAETLYREILERDPEQPDALHLLGLVAQAAGDLTSAAVGIRCALALRPGEAVFHYNLANVLRDAGRLDEAIASYRTALALHNVNRVIDADTLLNLGNALAAHGEPEEAADSYRTLLRHAPQHFEAQVNLGQVLRALGDVTGARTAYQAVEALDPGNVDAQLGLGALCQETGDFAAAYRHYQAALQTDPGCAPAWNNLGTWHQERGERAAAADCYRRALALDSECGFIHHAEAYNNLGTLLADEDRTAEAEACYRAALQVRPEFAEAHKNRGAVLQALGRRDGALASFRAAVRLRPDFAEAAYKLAALSGEQSPASAPAEYVAALFDSYAGEYDQHLTATLQYRVPQALCALLAERVPECGGLDVLDLGCGTGLSGAALRGLARQLTGIDLSPGMLARARERGLYDRLIEGDIVQVLAGQGASFDLVAAADVFVYIGDLEAVVASVGQVLRPGGWLTFSVESLPEGEYRLQPTGRYAHAPAYIEALARRHGFERVAEQAVTLRVEQGKPVAGQLQLWRRLRT